MELQLNRYECADGGWLFRTQPSEGQDEEPFALFVDCKSAANRTALPKVEAASALADNFVSENGSVGLQSFLPGKGKQAKHLLNIASAVQNCRDRDRNCITKGSLADALAQGNFLYVYLNTGSEKTFGVENHILHLGRNETEKFLSFFKELYALYRYSSKAADKEQEAREEQKAREEQEAREEKEARNALAEKKAAKERKD